jgi:hypothetical protein
MTTMSTDQLLARQRRVHEFFTGRGWDLEGSSDPGSVTFLDDTRAGWVYPGCYGGVAMNAVEGMTPVGLQGYFTFDNDGEVVLCVVAAGNLRGSGCAEHDTGERFFPAAADGGFDLDEVGALLDTLEPRARALDPRALIECRFFGPCVPAPETARRS